MMKASAVKRWRKRAERKSRGAISAKLSVSQQIEAEKQALELWLRHELKYDAYHDLLFLGIGAFALTGKLMTQAEIAVVFPPNEEGIGGLKEFIWDVTRNDCRLTIRIMGELGL
jgi:hypothetical protein